MENHALLFYFPSEWSLSEKRIVRQNTSETPAPAPVEEPEARETREEVSAEGDIEAKASAGINTRAEEANGAVEEMRDEISEAEMQAGVQVETSDQSTEIQPEKPREAAAEEGVEDKNTSKKTVDYARKIFNAEGPLGPENISALKEKVRNLARNEKMEDAVGGAKKVNEQLQQLQVELGANLQELSDEDFAELHAKFLKASLAEELTFADGRRAKFVFTLDKASRSFKMDLLSLEDGSSLLNNVDQGGAENPAEGNRETPDTGNENSPPNSAELPEPKTPEERMNRAIETLRDPQSLAEVLQGFMEFIKALKDMANGVESYDSGESGGKKESASENAGENPGETPDNDNSEREKDSPEKSETPSESAETRELPIESVQNPKKEAEEAGEKLRSIETNEQELVKEWKEIGAQIAEKGNEYSPDTADEIDALSAKRTDINRQIKELQKEKSALEPRKEALETEQTRREELVAKEWADAVKEGRPEGAIVEGVALGGDGDDMEITLSKDLTPEMEAAIRAIAEAAKGGVELAGRNMTIQDVAPILYGDNAAEGRKKFFAALAQLVEQVEASEESKADTPSVETAKGVEGSSEGEEGSAESIENTNVDEEYQSFLDARDRFYQGTEEQKKDSVQEAINRAHLVVAGVDEEQREMTEGGGGSPERWQALDAMRAQAQDFLHEIEEEIRKFQLAQQANQVEQTEDVLNRKELAFRRTEETVNRIIGREEQNMRTAEQEREASGVFGKFNRLLTTSDPYQIEINKHRQVAETMKYNLRLLKEAQAIQDPVKQLELLNGVRRACGLKEIADFTYVESDKVASTGVNKIDADQEHFEIEQDALTTSRDTAITGIVTGATLGTGAAFSGAAKGTQVALSGWQSGMVMGGTIGAAESTGRAVDDVKRGAKTVGEAAKDVAKDTAIGTAGGGLLGGAADKVVGRLTRTKGSPAIRNAGQEKLPPTNKAPNNPPSNDVRRNIEAFAEREGAPLRRRSFTKTESSNSNPKASPKNAEPRATNAAPKTAPWRSFSTI